MSLSDLFSFISEHGFLFIVLLFVFIPLYFRFADLVSGRRNRAKEREQLDSSRAELVQLRKKLFDERAALEKLESDQRDQLRIRAIMLDEREASLNVQIKERSIALARNVSSRHYLSDSPSFTFLRGSSPAALDALQSVLSHDLKISSPFDISANVQSSDGTVYHTTLYKCSCPDFSSGASPCSHMLRLAIETGLLFSLSPTRINSDISSLSARRTELLRETESISSVLSSQSDILSRLIDDESQTFPWVRKLYEDFCFSKDISFVDYLDSKPHPAHGTARDIERLIRGELSSCRSSAKQFEYQLNFYESLFPWLLSFKEIPPLEAANYASSGSFSSEDRPDSSRLYLSPEEYFSLSPSARDQLALDRYIKKEKSPWEVGIEYERYIGYLCESRGYSVKYNGAITCKEDMGRDLILEDGSKTILIQCKRWSRSKVIHENHVFQLAESTYEYQYSNPDREVIGAFVTTTDFSPVASHCASLLGILLFPNIPFGEYPRIKCNIGSDEYGLRSKIYHLPMDQQYDNVKISEPGECCVFTVREAIENGFRRAYKWHSNSQ